MRFPRDKVEREKQRGPRTEPCGIPTTSWRRNEEAPPKDTLSNWSCRRGTRRGQNNGNQKRTDKIARRAWMTVLKVTDRSGGRG